MVRRGSTGDSSGNDFGGVGGGSDTDAGSGSTGDSSDNDFGGGSDTDDGGGSDSGGFGGGGDSDSGSDGSGGFGGGGDDDDSDYDPNPSDRETGGSDDQTVDDITGGRDYGEEQPQSTGDESSQNQGGAGGIDDTDTDDDTDTTASSNNDLETSDPETLDRGLQTYLDSQSADATPGVEARDDEIGQRARELESEAANQLPVETEQTPFEAEELIRVTREDQRLQTELTQAGIRVFQARAAQEAGLRPDEDFASVENAVRAEETDDGLALELTDLGRRQVALRQTLQENPELNEEDVVVTSTEDGDLDVQLTGSGQDKLTETTTETDTITVGSGSSRGPGDAGADIITGQNGASETPDQQPSEFAEEEEAEAIDFTEQFSVQSFVNTPFRSLQTAGRRREKAVINTALGAVGADALAFRRGEQTGASAGYDPTEVNLDDVDADLVSDYLRGGAVGGEREQRFLSREVQPRLSSAADAVNEQREEVAAAAAVGVAAPEPVTSIGGAVVLGGLAVGGVAAATASQADELDIPEDEERGELETPTDTQRTELEAPEEQPTSTNELDVPQEEQRIEAEVPEQDASDEIEPTIELAEAAQKSEEEEGEDEEDEEDEEDDEEEGEEDEQNPFREIAGGERVVPEEMLPDEEVVIGDPEQEAQQRQEEVQEAEEDLAEEPIEESEEVVGSDQGDEELFPAGDEPPQSSETEEAVDSKPAEPQQTDAVETFPGADAGAEPQETIPGMGERQDQRGRARTDVDVGSVEAVAVGARSAVAPDTLADVTPALQIQQSLQQATSQSVGQPTQEGIGNPALTVEEPVLEEPTATVSQNTPSLQRRIRIDDERRYSSAASDEAPGGVYDKRYEGFVVEPGELDERFEDLTAGLDDMAMEGP